MKTIKIFLASSAELSEDREEVREMLSVENDRLHNKGIYLQLVQWEYFFDAVASTRLQDAYNKAIADCDIVLSLFHTKAAKYTQEEFEFALAKFKETGRPWIYTYFKDIDLLPDGSNPQSQSLIDFKAHLSTLGHFYTRYTGISDLKYQFKLQLDTLLESLHPEPDLMAATEPQRGVLLYKVPPRMQLQILHRCLVRVGYEKDTVLQDLPSYADDYTLRDRVRMADSMEVILVENTAFEVIAINDEQQAVEKGDFTEWNFDVRPLQLGRYPLTFRVSVTLPNGAKQVVLTESVEVVTEVVEDVLETKKVGLALNDSANSEATRSLEADDIPQKEEPSLPAVSPPQNLPGPATPPATVPIADPSPIPAINLPPHALPELRSDDAPSGNVVEIEPPVRRQGEQEPPLEQEEPPFQVSPPQETPQEGGSNKLLWLGLGLLAVVVVVLMIIYL